MNRIKRWKEWRKHTDTNFGYQLLVLFGIKFDGEFEMTFTEEETMRLVEGIRRLQQADSFRFNPDQAFEDDGK